MNKKIVIATFEQQLEIQRLVKKQIELLVNKSEDPIISHGQLINYSQEISRLLNSLQDL